MNVTSPEVDNNITSPEVDNNITLGSTRTFLFSDFCAGVPFWDEADLNKDIPVFSPCYIDTALVWFPCAFLWILTPFYVIYLYHGKRITPLPFSKLHASKVVVACLVLCMPVLQLILQEHYGYQCKNGAKIPPATYAAIAIKFATFILTILVQEVQRSRGMKTSGIPFCFWMFLVACEIIPLYSHGSKQSICGEDVVYFIYFVLICVQWFLHCFAEQYNTNGYQEMDKDNPCPDENASVLNHVWFHWLTPLVWQAYRKTFSSATFWDQTPRLKSEHLCPLLEDEWVKEVKHCQNTRRKNEVIHYKVVNGQLTPKQHTESTPILNNDKQDRYGTNKLKEESYPQPNLFKVIFRVFIANWWEATSFMGIGEIFWFLQPIILRYIIQLIESKGTEMDVEPVWKGYMYSLLLLIALSANSFLYHISFHHMMTLGLKVKTALIGLIYKKALTMKRSGAKSTTVGEIVNLMSVDCQRIQDAFLFSFYVILIFLVLGIATVQLWDLMGVASIGCLAIIVMALGTVAFIATLQYKIQKALLDLKGDRIKTLNEVVGGIKVLKMYAWEPSFMRKIQDIRALEIKKLWRYAILTATTVVFAIHSPFMMNFVLVLIYVLTSPTHSLGAEEAFTALSIINILRYPIALCPFLVNGAVQACVSVGRIQDFLRLEDLNTNNINIVKSAEHPVTIDDGTFTWNMESPEPTLHNVNIKVKEGELVAVVGNVGSGKSSLMSACIGEMERLNGSVTLKGKIAYVPQEAWIQNMTLRDNILFGREYTDRKYNKVLEACALLPDLKILAGGDMTEIGEKGINISGGQKQRVSLARAVYNNADVYFLDDPLSAVDSHVGKHLFKHVISNTGLLQNKTRILVTHGIHWLPMVDRIFVLNNGTIAETGTYEELITRDGDFAKFLHQYLQQDDSDTSDPEVERMKDEMRTKIEERLTDGGLTSDDDGVARIGKRQRKKSQRMSGTTKSDVIEKPTLDLSRLIADETSEEGSIKPVVLLTYMRAMSYTCVVIVFLCVSLFQGLNVFSNFWLTFWTEDELLSNKSLSTTQEYEDRYMYYLLMYLMLGVLQGIFVFLGFYLAMTRMVKASGNLHNQMLVSILRSPMSFFDTTPIGRMMNRFSSDIDIMDNKLPESFRLWTIMVFSSLAVLVVVSVTTPIFIAAIIPIAIFYALCVKFYLPTARLMRRTESVNRSPIYNHFSETITGASVIRAFRCGHRFVEESRKRINTNIKFFYAANTGSRWIGIRLEILGNVIAFLATVFALVSDELTGAQVGLSITYAVQLTITLNLVVLAISEMEMNIVSAERVTEYTNLPTEADWTIDTYRADIGWPRCGKIEFVDYRTRYREGLDLVLRGINCTIKDGEKIGIVGRTGAGKSSLTQCLFRLVEAAGGKILIDGVDISQLGLHDLRNKLTILPQDPVIFSGSLRTNLDPFGRFNDDNVWYALECAHLKFFVQGLEEGLDYECGEGGQNLSVGQRQLVCLARTLLHKTRVLILDEATAAVDMETDDLIQDTIRSQFKECTIITVAHRLNTIMDYDRVMVLDAGLIKEFDSPQRLLQNTNGAFYGMAKDAGLV